MNNQGVDEVTGYGLQVTGEKFIENGQLYIRVGENMFDARGNRVE
jgi:hypothetical protein